MRTANILAALVLLIAASAVNAQSTIRVPGDQPTIQAGIDVAVDGDTVLVADGTYTADGNTRLNYSGKLITVRSENGTEFCIIDCERDGRAVKFVNGETSLAVFEGFTVINGLSGAGGGGAIFCKNESSPTIRGCVFRDCESPGPGGAIASEGGSVIVEDCQIRHCTSGEDGGAILCRNGSSPTIRGCVFLNCESAGSGGAIECEGGNVIVEDCQIRDCTSGENGGGISFADGVDGIVRECEIRNNRTRTYGGGISLIDSVATIEDCVIEWNKTKFSGGGIRTAGTGTTTFSRCVIRRNKAADADGAAQAGGGATFSIDSTVALQNCAVIENWPNGLELANNNVSRIDNCTISGNLGIGLLVGSQGIAQVVVDSSIIWGNTRGAIADPVAGTQSVSYSVVENGWPGIGNLVGDPLLTRDTLHLQANSPGRDAGDPNTALGATLDTDGEDRISGARIDVGADEWMDFDSDALPDWWEARHFGTTTGGNANADDDEDALNNLGEYIENRNPLRPPTIFYVDVAGSDVSDGLAPAWDGVHGPKATIQAAIDTADSFELDTVEVGDGVFAGRGNRNINPCAKRITVRSANGPMDCIIDCENQGRGFVFQSAESELTMVTGFTITNGMALGGGAGVLFRRQSNARLTECVIRGNTAPDSSSAGAGICIMDSSPRLKDLTITENVLGSDARGFGVALYAQGFEHLHITHCIISRNLPGLSGLRLINGDQVVIEDCDVSANAFGGISISADSATIRRTSVMNNGWVGVDVSNVDVTVEDCIIAGNTVSSSGGGAGGAGIRASYCDLQVDGTLFQDNRAGCFSSCMGGGGITLRFSRAEVRESSFVNNFVVGGGGAISYVSYTNTTGLLQVSDCLFVGNRSTGLGGGIEVAGASPLTIQRSVFVGNDASGARAVFAGSSSNVRRIASSIFWDNGVDPLVLQQSNADQVVRYSDIEGGFPGVGNIDADPMFVDADGPDDDPNTLEDNNYRLTAGSPSIDAGDPNTAFDPIQTDLDGRLRVWDGDAAPGARVDMGAYEFAAPCLGDIDDDDVVALGDLGIMLANFGTQSGAAYEDGDLDLDGDVDLADLGILLSAFGTTCE